MTLFLNRKPAWALDLDNQNLHFTLHYGVDTELTLLTV